MNSRARFLNVDLEIESLSKLDLLAAEFGDRVLVLYAGPAAGTSKTRRYLLVLETVRSYKEPNSNIRAFCALVKSLSPTCRKLWKRARKEFDVGCEIEPSQTRSRFSLNPETLARVVALGAALTVTYYPANGAVAREVVAAALND